MNTRVDLHTPSLPRRLARGVYGFLELLALAGAIAGAVFGYLAWASPDQSDAARNTGKLVHLYTQALEQEERRLVLDRATLASLERMLPEAERTRLGVEQLVGLIDLRLAGVREARRKLKADAQPRQAPVGPSWWDRNGPDSPASITAKKILDQMGQP